ncbi:MAG: hypothetical protein U1E63_02425 [Burkholderiales bacterium]
MQKSIIAALDESLLETKTADSDRFVLCNYVMPLQITFADDVTPILPLYKIKLLIAFARTGIIDGLRLQEAVPSLDVGEVLSRNRIELADRIRVDEPRRAATPNAWENTDAVARLDDATDLLDIVGTAASSESERAVVRAVRAKVSEAKAAFARAPPPTQEETIEFFLGLLQSDIAYFFFDRTRIRPKGFRVGEHVYALALAPGEEVTIEQKTFTKRQTTFEEQNEREAIFDLELASTLTTELQEGFQRQKNLTDTWGMNVGKTGSYSSPIISDVAYGSFNTNHTFGYTKNITAADNETKSRSIRDSQTASAKVASKYRTAHKTTFKVAVEQGFESTTKRIIRNPNAFTPVTLHYFKILQRLKMTHERYGVRLGWMPCIKDPAFGFFEQIRQGKAKILADAEAALPRKPDEPQRHTAETSAALPQAKWFPSGILLAGNGAADGSMSNDFDLDVPFDDGWEWDGVVENIDVRTYTIRSPERYSSYVKGWPVVVKDTGAGSALRVVVHVGAMSDPVRRAQIELQVNVWFVPKPLPSTAPPDDKAAEELAQYRIALNDWEAKCEEQRALARKAADDWAAAMLRSLNPVSEMVNQIIKQSFPPNVRDEGWEIDLWQKLFDWERASYVAYPGWWADRPLRDPLSDASEFINASWARLYLPVRVGMERLALRWIHGRTTRRLDAAVETRFDAIEADLKKYRKERFGAELEMMAPAADGTYQEKYEALATWTDFMPTDGTHLEIVQGMTSAADEITTAAARGRSTMDEEDD